MSEEARTKRRARVSPIHSALARVFIPDGLPGRDKGARI